MSMTRRAKSGTFRIAVDVGGTFTDLVAFETDTGTGQFRVLIEKSDTTPPAFENGVLDVLSKAGIEPGNVELMIHGTTVVINALTERKGAKVGLITTEGFRDALEIARGNRPDFFNLHYRKPPPFVPRHLRRELPGRMSYKGEELAPLDLSSLADILSDFRREGVEAVALCFLHAYANPAHEDAAYAAVRNLWPGVAAVASHQITREWREYERTNTTVLSAYVQPVAEKYLRRLDTALRDRDFRKSLYVMQSNCGVGSLEFVSRIPITMVESGPASGFWGAAELGKLIGELNILALDIGGTTAKCSLIQDGQVTIKTDYWIERDSVSAGYPIMVPVVDLVEIGNGGGSIATVDKFGKLLVGPRSAGAMPGPVAYGRGGTDPTTTDAHLWLGRINPDYFCGGAFPADMAAVEKALRALAEPVGMGPTEIARGIVRIANNNMVNALKLVSVNRGFDPRDFTLVAFGGGGAMHAVALGSELGVKKVVIPVGASVFSAWGMMMSDLRRDYFVTRLLDVEPASADAIQQTFVAAEQNALREFQSEGVPPGKVGFQRFARLRYLNQDHTIEVPVAAVFDAGQVSGMVELFHQTYQREYTYRLANAVEMVGIHLIATAEIDKLTISEHPRGGEASAGALKGVRDVDYASEGIHSASIYDGARLQAGMSFTGPAIIEDTGTTVVVHPGNRVDIDRFRNIHIELSGKANDS